MKRPKMIDAHVLRLVSSDLRKPRHRQHVFAPYPVRAYAIRGPFPFRRLLAHRPTGSYDRRNWYLTDARSGASLFWGGMGSIDNLLDYLARSIAVKGISQQKLTAIREKVMRESHSKPLNTSIPDSAYQPWPAGGRA